MDTHNAAPEKQDSSPELDPTLSRSNYLDSTSGAIYGSRQERDQISFHPTPSTSTSTVTTRSAFPSQGNSVQQFYSVDSGLDGREKSKTHQRERERRASTEVPTYPSPPKSSPSPKAAPIISHPVRSVTISEDHGHDRRDRRNRHLSGDDDRAFSGSDHEQPRSNSRARRSVDAKPRRSESLVRRSISLAGIRRGDGVLPDPLREPRRSIGKRPEEFDLKARDLHSGALTGSKEATNGRQVAFAAPYARSGIVLSSPATWSDFRVPGPLTLGHGQWWYLIAGQSILAAVISGAINFGVGVATYNSYEPPTVLRLWQWIPVPLAGDMGVTVIVQQIISMLITSALVHHDLTDGPVGPLRRPWPPLLHLPSTPDPTGSWLGCKLKSEVPMEKPLYMGKAHGQGKLKCYWWWFVRAALTGSERNDLLAKGISWRQRSQRILWTAVQGFILCLLTFPWFWPISIAIVAPIYQDRNLAGTWIPPIIKLLYGGIMALLTNPVMALLAMGAESSVRRAYPELDIWQAFGGQADYQAWLTEHNLTGDDVEIGPNGLARSSMQIVRRPQRAAGLESDDNSMEQDTTEGGEASRRQSRDRSVGSSRGRGGLAGGTVISKHITEEQSVSSPKEAEGSSSSGAPPLLQRGLTQATVGESAESFVSAA